VTDRQSPVNHGKELSLQDVELRHGDSANFGIQAVCAKCVAETLAGHRDGCDDKAMAGQTGKDEEGHASTYLVNIE
jgi:hypothetical protein